MRLLEKLGYSVDLPLRNCRFDDPIGTHTFVRDVLESDHRSMIFLECFDELLGSCLLTSYEIVSEENKTRFITDPLTCSKESISISSRDRLAYIGDMSEVRNLLDLGELSDFSLLDERLFELE